MAQYVRRSRYNGDAERRRSLLLVLLLSTVGSSSALFGRRRGGRYRGGIPRPDIRRQDPAYRAYRQKVFGEAATTFRPHASEEEEEEAEAAAGSSDYDHGEQQQQTGDSSRKRRDEIKKQREMEKGCIGRSGYEALQAPASAEIWSFLPQPKNCHDECGVLRPAGLEAGAYSSLCQAIGPDFAGKGIVSVSNASVPARRGSPSLDELLLVAKHWS